MTRSLSIAAVGEIYPDDHFYAGDSPKNPEFEATLELLRGADLRFGNFEACLSTRGQPAEKLLAGRNDPKVAGDLARLGLDLVSLANNHVCDYGPDALADAIRALEAIGVRHVGTGESLEAALAPTLFEVNGLSVGFVAFTCLAAPGPVATAERPGVAAIRVHGGFEVDPFWQIEEPGHPLMVRIRTRVDESGCQAALGHIEALAADVDVLCVSVHWGYGGSAELAEYQRPLAHAIVEAGADAVLGNHVHNVQGVEIHRGAPILYSAGSHLGWQAPIDTSGLSETMKKLYAEVSPDGYVACLRFGEDGPCGVEITPTTLGRLGLPVLAEDASFDRIVERLCRHSEQLDTRLTLSERMLVPAVPAGACS